MKMVRCSLMIIMCCCCLEALAQHPLDRYLAGTPTTTTIGTAANAGLLKPVDLEFNLKPGRRHELWVLNRDDNAGSSMSIFYHAGTPEQVIEKRKDSHRGHFMVNCPAFAMSDTGDFTTVQEVRNSTGSATETFMGPVLWTSDTSIFARTYQSNWEPTEPLGSHIDMLHQSPYAMGVAWEKDNIYWVFDGHNKNIVSYNFQTPHDIGADDHSDGILKRYTEVQVKRTANKPSHMVIDHKTNWLYIVDNGNKRVLRLDITSGEPSTSISNPYETLEEYYRVKTVTWEVFIDSGLVMPVGIDVMDGRLVVTDDNNGDIIFYDLTKNKKNAEIGRVKTGKKGIAGITIAPDSTLWYMNTTANEVVHLVPDTKPVVALIYPEQNATKIPTTDTLRWSGSNATNYRVQLTDASSTIIDTIIASTSLPFTGLSNLTSYSWRVMSMNSEDSSDWSNTSRFTTVAPAPIAVTLLSPVNNALDVLDSATFLWHTTLYATEYHFQLAESATFSSLTADLTLNDTTSYISKLLPSRVYYWRVGAIGEDGKDVWSETWSFTRNSLGIDNVRSVASLSVYPNPASSTTNISLSLTEATPLTVSLYSLLGENLMTIYNGYGTLGANSFIADVSKLVAGVYHLRIETTSGIVVRQIVIQ
jgi:hypothetical protein